ncbi:MAG: hypothetical protein QMB51_01755, partial [Patescibacteria group bacterium]
WNKDQFINDCMSMVINREDLESNNIPKDYFSTSDIEFVEKERKEILSKVFDNFNLSEGYKDKFYTNLSAKIMFYIQYFAGSPTLEYARSISYFNITTYIAATLNKELSAHREGYGLVDRLKVFNFYIYEKNVYMNCMAKIALASLRDHYIDQEDDIKKGYQKFNPFLTGEINEEMFKEFEIGLIDITKKEI